MKQHLFTDTDRISNYATLYPDLIPLSVPAEFFEIDKQYNCPRFVPEIAEWLAENCVANYTIDAIYNQLSKITNYKYIAKHEPEGPLNRFYLDDPSAFGWRSQAQRKLAIDCLSFALDRRTSRYRITLVVVLFESDRDATLFTLFHL